MRIRWPFLAALFVSVVSSETSAAQSKDIVGRLEKVRIYPGDLVIRAKLDTGARHSSLHAPKIVRFEKNGETWVRFSVTDYLDEERTIERKIIREAKIKDRNGGLEERPVVVLGICLGRLYREAEVNLVDREGFLYPMLIGRSYMIGHLLVDPELKYTSEPACVGAPKP